MKMPGRDDHGFVDINAMALNAAIKGSILAEPEACLVNEDRVALRLNARVGHRLRHQTDSAMTQGAVGQLYVAGASSIDRNPSSKAS